MNSAINAEKINKINNPDLSVVSWDRYLSGIKRYFQSGKDNVSRPYLLVRMYEQVVARDDFANILIIDDKKDAVDNQFNYLLLGNKYTIMMRSFKTDKLFRADFDLDASLTDLLRRYILENKLTKYLFPNKKKDGPMKNLVEVVKNMNDKIPEFKKMTINTIRYSYISYYRKQHPNMTPRENLSFSKRCFHSAETSSTYVRQIDPHSQFNPDSQMFH